ncbi:MBL fold metallo-hydrolase [Piscinibacter sp.]|uniref:MBL fold metallo-hydrolase n=1 Tax=Piscinibacter sp. TaxID=1903157 RepID=UPI003559A333
MPRLDDSAALVPALAGLTVLERGWLSSNNILIHAAGDEAGAVLVDSSHVNHAEQTVALVRHALRGQRLDRVVNTHLHSDHCGGNAALQRAFGVPVIVPPGLADAVREWDAARLTHESSGQRCERFEAAGTFAPGDEFSAGGRRWQVLPAPGHDPHSVMLFDPAQGVLLSADALWENGFGVVFPEIAGEPGFDDVGAVLDAIERLPVRVVVPGHGAPFSGVAAALARARSRLAGFQAEPARHARHAVKVLVKYHVMEERSMPLDALLRWAAATPMLGQLWQRHGVRDSGSPAAWCEHYVHELVAGGALALHDGVVSDR